MSILDEDLRPLNEVARELDKFRPGERRINVALLARWALRGTGPAGNRVKLETVYAKQTGLLTSAEAVVRFLSKAATARQPADRTRERRRLVV